MLERMQSKSSTLSLLVGMQTSTTTLEVSMEVSENWESTYFKTQQYHFWAYIQRLINHTTKAFVQLRF